MTMNGTLENGSPFCDGTGHRTGNSRDTLARSCAGHPKCLRDSPSSEMRGHDAVRRSPDRLRSDIRRHVCGGLGLGAVSPENRRTALRRPMRAPLSPPGAIQRLWCCRRPQPAASSGRHASPGSPEHPCGIALKGTTDAASPKLSARGADRFLDTIRLGFAPPPRACAFGGPASSSAGSRRSEIRTASAVAGPVRICEGRFRH